VKWSTPILRACSSRCVRLPNEVSQKRRDALAPTSALNAPAGAEPFSRPHGTSDKHACDDCENNGHGVLLFDRAFLALEHAQKASRLACAHARGVDRESAGDGENSRLRPGCLTNPKVFGVNELPPSTNGGDQVWRTYQKSRNCASGSLSRQATAMTRQKNGGNDQ